MIKQAVKGVRCLIAAFLVSDLDHDLDVFGFGVHGSFTAGGGDKS